MNRKLILITFVILLVITLLINTVSASSFSASMTASKNTVAESTEFTITVKVSNIDAGINGINSVSGIFSYDTKVFETITSSSISGLNSWQPNYFPDTGKIILLKTSYAKTDEDVLQVTLKTKAGTAGKSGVVSFKSIVASDSTVDIPASDISTTITVGNTPTSIGDGNSSNSNSQQPQQINASTSNANNNKTNTNTNTEKPVNNVVKPAVNNTPKNVEVQESGDIPYTGASDNIMKAIFVVLVLAGISYFKYESIK